MLARRIGGFLALAALSSCVSIRIGDQTNDGSFFKSRGLASAYGTFHGLDGWDGSVFSLGILTNTRGNELVSVEVGPLAAVGVGLVGARVRVLPLELAAGALLYKPKPPEPKPSKAEEKPPALEQAEAPAQPKARVTM